MSDAAYRFDTTDQHIRLDAEDVTTGAGAVKRLRVGSGDSALAFRFDGAASPVLYLGEARPGTAEGAAGWRIMRINTTSVIKIEWADGNNDFDNIWTNRAALSYS